MTVANCFGEPDSSQRRIVQLRTAGGRTGVSFAEREGVHSAIVQLPSFEGAQEVRLGKISKNSPGDRLYITSFLHNERGEPYPVILPAIYIGAAENFVSNTTGLTGLRFAFIVEDDRYEFNRGGAVFNKYGELVGIVYSLIEDQEIGGVEAKVGFAERSEVVDILLQH